MVARGPCERGQRAVVTVQKTPQAFKVVGRKLHSRIGLNQKVHVSAGRLLRRVALQCFEERTGVGRVDNDQLPQAARVQVAQRELPRSTLEAASRRVGTLA